MDPKKEQEGKEILKRLLQQVQQVEMISLDTSPSEKRDGTPSLFN